MREAVRRERDVVRGRAHHGRIRHVPRAEHEVDRGARVLDVRDRIQGTRAADRLARADERRGARGALRRDEVEGPALVVGAPAAPVAAALEERAEGVVVLIGLVTVSPDPRWAIYPLMGVLFIITAAFRLGWGGTLAATAILSLEIVGVAIWRDLALGLRVDTPYVAFDLLMYGLTALLTTAMLNELGALRRERTVLMARASDVEILRRAERERGELLDRERSARADAELATARPEALQQVADAALSRARLDDGPPDIPERVAQLFDADFAVVLQRAQAQGTYALRASSTRGQVPRTVVLLQGGDAERATRSARRARSSDVSRTSRASRSRSSPTSARSISSKRTGPFAASRSPRSRWGWSATTGRSRAASVAIARTRIRCGRSSTPQSPRSGTSSIPSASAGSRGAPGTCG